MVDGQRLGMHAGRRPAPAPGLRPPAAAHLELVFVLPVAARLAKVLGARQQLLDRVPVAEQDVEPAAGTAAGGWRWALLQLGWMSSLAWVAGAIAFRLVAA